MKKRQLKKLRKVASRIIPCRVKYRGDCLKILRRHGDKFALLLYKGEKTKSILLFGGNWHFGSNCGIRRR